MKVFLIILLTLLVYNLFGTILYFTERHSRIAGFTTLLYLVGVYLPIVFLIEGAVSFVESRSRRSLHK